MRFIRKDHETSIPENTPPGSVLLTTGVNKVDSVSQNQTREFIIPITQM